MTEERLTREGWRELKRGVRLRDRGGRQWEAKSDAYLEGREYRVVLASGDYVLIETEWHAEDYVVVGG